MAIVLQFDGVVYSLSLRKMCKYLFIAFAIIFALPVKAQQKKQVTISVTTGVFKFHAQKPAVLSCNVQGNLLKGKAQDIQIALFAQNNLRQIPMELYRGDSTLNIMPVLIARKNKYYPVFTASLEDIFGLNPAQTPYRWKWAGRAKTPVSPVADVAGEKVKTVKCWVVLHIGTHNYSSDTTIIQVQQ